MIQLLATTAHQPAAKLVLAALRRSVSYDQANWLSISAFDESSQRVELIVTIDPNARLGEALVRRLDGPPCKIIVLGALPDALVSRFGATKGVWPDGISEWAQSPSAPTHGFAESPGRIVYRPAAGVFQADSWTRPLERFDFTDEWNNLGFGAVRADESCW